MVDASRNAKIFNRNLKTPVVARLESTKLWPRVVPTVFPISTALQQAQPNFGLKTNSPHKKASCGATTSTTKIWPKGQPLTKHAPSSVNRSGNSSGKIIFKLYTISIEIFTQMQRRYSFGFYSDILSKHLATSRETLQII
jgi:hypothetical protein